MWLSMKQVNTYVITYLTTLEWGGGSPFTGWDFSCVSGGLPGTICPPFVRPSVRSFVRQDFMVSKRPMKPLVCARFRAWGGKKVVFIWVANFHSKWRKFWSFYTFWRFLSRNVTFFALKGWITFKFSAKCEKWPFWEAKTSYTSKKVASFSFLTFFTNH